MADPFTGEIRAFGFNYAPYDWAFCDGSRLPIQQNPPLFAILGANYGGDGTTYFNLPDLRGKAVIGATDNQVNDPQGEISTTLTVNQMPDHTHTLYGAFNQSQSSTAALRLPSKLSTAGSKAYVTTGDTPSPVLTQLAAPIVSNVGKGAAHENRQPYQVMNFCICLYGDWPMRP